jgi:hypothetical protein
LPKDVSSPQLVKLVSSENLGNVLRKGDLRFAAALRYRSALNKRSPSMNLFDDF